MHIGSCVQLDSYMYRYSNIHMVHPTHNMETSIGAGEPMRGKLQYHTMDLGQGILGTLHIVSQICTKMKSVPKIPYRVIDANTREIVSQYL